MLQKLLSNEHRGLDDPRHPGHDMYRKSYSRVESLNAKHGVPASGREKDFAASIAAGAKAQGLGRVDHVLSSDDGSRTFAIQGNLHRAHGLDRQIADLQTAEALDTPLAQSSNTWIEHAFQGQLAALQQHAQAQTQAQAETPQAQQLAPQPM